MEWKHCTRCGNVLMGNEQVSETCNRCLDLGYQSMGDEEYAALDTDGHERLMDRARVARGWFDSARNASDDERRYAFLSLFHPEMTDAEKRAFNRACHDA